jgi:protein-S-isoprenylcysteine O-methyltransferase Ste14
VLWLRGAVFTVLVPYVVAVYLPKLVDPAARRHGAIFEIGWPLIIAGTLIYAFCLIRFLLAGGTPAIFFIRHLSFLVGEEPASLVSSGLYRYSRNPMYIGVLLVIFGQAILFASSAIALYGCFMFLMFHVVVVTLEEPHLRAVQGPSYEAYCRAVPRWFGVPRPPKVDL